jgi:hypothetical protein
MHIFFTSALVGGDWSASRPCHFIPRETAPRTHLLGGWLNPRTGLDNMENREFFILLGPERRHLGRPARSHSSHGYTPKTPN